MPDITMCITPCPIQGTCYRAQAMPSEYSQSYAAFCFTVEGGSIKCDKYLPIEKTTTKGCKHEYETGM